MPKSQYVDPGKAFDAGYIKFEDIPVCQYNKTLAEEMEIYSKDDMMRIYRDMAIIREFETMLNEVKTKSCYNGVEYNNPGPAHLSIGQEASAVGQAYCLDINDFTFGSHRSHGEILAKGLSSIEKLTDEEVYDIMKEFLGGNVLSVVEKHMKSENVKDLAINFLLYGALAGGPDGQDNHIDVTSDYIYNEVTIDYNAAFVGACAGLYEYYGTPDMKATENFPPTPSYSAEEGGGNG